MRRNSAFGLIRVLILVILPVATLCPAALDADTPSTEACSLVIDGRLYDVELVQDLSQGRMLSAAAFNLIATADPHIAGDTRPDRGHIVLTSGVTQPKNVPIRGFKTSRITIVVDGKPTTVEARLLSGIPFLTLDTFQTILTALKFNVLYSMDTNLIAVSHSQPASREAGGASPSGVTADTGSEPSEASTQGPPGTDLLEMVQQGAAQALGQMGAAYGVSPSASGSTGVCGAMDELRTLWEATEPSALEKATFRALAEKFQEAKDNHGSLDPTDVDNMVRALASFRAKVDRRTEGTRDWNAPPEATSVKTYGVSFLDTFTQAMDLGQAMMKAIQDQNREFVDQAEDMIGKLKNLEATIQQQGMQFDKEVLRVRQTYGCGPARSGVPPS